MGGSGSWVGAAAADKQLRWLVVPGCCQVQPKAWELASSTGVGPTLGWSQPGETLLLSSWDRLSEEIPPQSGGRAPRSPFTP